MLSVFFLSITEIFGTLLSVASVFEIPLLNLKTRPLMFQTGPDNSHDLPFLLRTLFDVVLHALELSVKKIDYRTQRSPPTCQNCYVHSDSCTERTI